MLARQAVDTVRSMLQGSNVDELSTLASPYATTDTTITLAYPKRAATAGTVLSVGLNTFTVMASNADGSVLTVLPGVDGGPNVAAPAGEIVRIRPKVTTWSIFRELQSEIDSMSAPDNGLFWPWILDHSDIDYVSGVYMLPLSVDGPRPFRLLKSEFLQRGTAAWVPFTDARYVRQANYVRVLSDPPQAEQYRFTMAVAFGRMQDMDSELVDIGVTDVLAGIAMLGAAATLVLGWEGQRAQPISQGDTRRAEEVSIGGNAALSRQWRQRQKEAITEEQTRALAAYGYNMPLSYGYEQRVSR